MLFPVSVHVASFASTSVLLACAHVTVTEHVAVLLLVVVTVIVAVPSANAVTFPLSTVATDVLLLFHPCTESVVPSGANVATNATFSPDFKFNFVLSNVTPVAGTGFLAIFTTAGTKLY